MNLVMISFSLMINLSGPILCQATAGMLQCANELDDCVLRAVESQKEKQKTTNKEDLRKCMNAGKCLDWDCVRSAVGKAMRSTGSCPSAVSPHRSATDRLHVQLALQMKQTAARSSSNHTGGGPGDQSVIRRKDGTIDLVKLQAIQNEIAARLLTKMSTICEDPIAYMTCAHQVVRSKIAPKIPPSSSPANARVFYVPASLLRNLSGNSNAVVAKFQRSVLRDDSSSTYSTSNDSASSSASINSDKRKKREALKKMTDHLRNIHKEYYEMCKKKASKACQKKVREGLMLNQASRYLSDKLKRYDALNAGTELRLSEQCSCIIEGMDNEFSSVTEAINEAKGCSSAAGVTRPKFDVTAIMGYVYGLSCTAPGEDSRDEAVLPL